METKRYDSLVAAVKPKRAVLNLLLIFYFIIYAGSTDKNTTKTTEGLETQNITSQQIDPEITIDPQIDTEITNEQPNIPEIANEPPMDWEISNEPPINPEITNGPPIDPEISTKPLIAPDETTVTAPLNGECKNVDVVIGVDASWSIEFPDLGNAKEPTGHFENVILKFADKLLTILDGDNCRSGLFVWSTNPETRFKHADDLSFNEKIEKISSTIFQGGNRWTGRAIEHGHKMLTEMVDVSRVDVNQILVIITNGEPYPQIQSPTVTEAVKKLNQNNIKAYAVGLGTHDIYRGLLEIAKTNDSIRFTDSWDDLISLADEIRGENCHQAYFINPPKSVPPKVDVVIGIDASRSIEFPDMNNLTTATGHFKNSVLVFVRRLVEFLGKKRYRTGLFVWSNNQKTIFGLNDKISIAEKIDKIADTPYLDGNRWTGEAIEYGRKMFEEMTDPSRVDVPKIFIMFIDGEPFPAIQSPTIEDAEFALSVDTVLAYVVRVGDADIPQGLLDIAESEDRIYSALDWNDLVAQADKIYDSLCSIEIKESEAIYEHNQCGKVDFVIGLDASYSINNLKGVHVTHYYEKHYLAFTHKLIENLDEEHYRTGIFVWSNTTEAVYSITDKISKAEKLDKIDRAPYLHENSLIGNAIEFGTGMLTDPSIPVRDHVPKVLIIMTDGDQFPLGAGVSIKDAAKIAEKEGINTIVIGLGNHYTFTTFLEITRDDTKRIFTSQTDNVKLLVKKIRRYFCQLPVYAVANEEYERTERQNYWSYFCFKDVPEGVGVEVTLLNKAGGTKAYFTFSKIFINLSEDDNHGTLTTGPNLIGQKLSKFKDLCVLVITGNESEYSTYSIRFNLNVDPNATIRFTDTD